MAQLVGCKTVLHEPTLERYLQRRGLARREDATPNLIKMATIPEVAEVFPNPAGWAPSLRVPFGDATLLILPGPPQEVMPRFTLHVGPYIAAQMPGKTASIRVAVTLPESELSGPMQEVMRQFPTCYLKAYVALRAAPGHPLPLDIVARGEDDADAQAVLRQATDALAALVSTKGARLESWDE